MKSLQIFVVLLLAVVCTGCGAGEPQFSTVTGTVTKGGQPVNMVLVRFVPVDEKLGKFIGSGVTDDEGNFTIAIPGREEDVCCTGQCKVTVREAPLPNDIRGSLEQDEGREGGSALMRYKASLKGRPIPSQYERLHSTPLIVTVGSGEFNLPIEL